MVGASTSPTCASIGGPAAIRDRLALIAEREDGSQHSYTFAELLETVERAAGALHEAGARNGATVAVYLPMSAEAIVSMLAIARIGAVFVPVFSGYGAEAVSARLASAAPSVVITADGYRRRGAMVAMKETADEAIDLAGVSPQTLVVAYADRSDTPFVEGRDRPWAPALGSADRRAAEPTASEDPVLLAYTSGTTGKPKGVVHVQGGLSVKLAVEGAFQFEVRPDDRVMWMTDMGWIMGPWMVVAGLANGASIACFDGAPDYPTPARTWELVESLGITVLGISPTLIRALQPHGAELAARADLSTLRAFGSTGETWNPDPWWWLFPRHWRVEVPDHQHLGRHRDRGLFPLGQHSSGHQAHVARGSLAGDGPRRVWPRRVTTARRGW